MKRLNEDKGTIEETGYECPKVVDYGDLVALTAGSSTGDYLDADFPAGTKRGVLTFSG